MVPGRQTQSLGSQVRVMGLLTHVKLGLERIEAEAVSSTTTRARTTTMATVTEVVRVEPGLKDSDRFFDVGEALRLIGELPINPADGGAL